MSAQESNQTIDINTAIKLMHIRVLFTVHISRELTNSRNKNYE